MLGRDLLMAAALRQALRGLHEALRALGILLEIHDNPAPREPLDGAPTCSSAVRFLKGIWGLSIEAQDPTPLRGMRSERVTAVLLRQRAAQICGGGSVSGGGGAAVGCAAA